jgi:hypothetical protein
MLQKPLSTEEHFRLPNVNTINRYVSAYIIGFSQHIPFLHLATLDTNTMQLPRLLAICSIGALYCFEKAEAIKLHSMCLKLLYQVYSVCVNLIEGHGGGINDNGDPDVHVDSTNDDVMSPICCLKCSPIGGSRNSQFTFHTGIKSPC